MAKKESKKFKEPKPLKRNTSSERRKRDAVAGGGRRDGKIFCCSLRTAGFVVAFVEFLLCILTVYGLFVNLFMFGGPYVIWFILGIISVIIILIAIILLIYAIKKESSRFLIPHISAQIFLIGWLIIVAIVVALLLLFGAYNGIRRLVGQGDYYTSNYSTQWLGIMIIIVYLAIAILEIFFLYIVWQLYKQYRAYEKLSGKYGKSGIIIKKRRAEDKTSLTHAPADGDWYIPPKNENSYGGSPNAGDIYPYEPPISPV
ncbi:hypothetical protein ACQ4LE_006574 [Meloidogyne hapla]|uniref:MARVEL domain-containing protein n=1 Tax=Meloidogyne hapla TaxID=6305 RepID=A0A1I8BZY5_MELHA